LTKQVITLIDHFGICTNTYSSSFWRPCLTTKERVNFPAANHYHVDSITHVNFMTGKLNAQEWQILKTVFQAEAEIHVFMLYSI